MTTFFKLGILTLLCLTMFSPNAKAKCADAVISCYHNGLEKGTYEAGAEWQWLNPPIFGRCCANQSQVGLCNEKVARCEGKCNEEYNPYLCTI